MATESVIAGRLLLIGFAAAAGLWLLLKLQLVVVAAFLAFALTALLWPLVRTMARILPSALAAMIAVAAFLAAFLTLLWFVAAELAKSWPPLQQAVVGGITSVDDWVRDAGISVPPDVADNVLRQLQSHASTLASGISGAALSGLNALSLLATILVVTMLLTIFALSSGTSLAEQVWAMTPAPRRDAMEAATRRSFVAARWWLLASTLTGLVDGVFIGLGMHLLGLPLAVPIAVLTFILGFIPMVGATLAGVLAVLVGLFFEGPLMALWVVLLVLAVQQIEGNVLSPLLMSRAMNFHPIVTLLLTTAGGFALGITGLFLAVPLVGVLSAAVRGWRTATRSATRDADDPPGRERPILGARTPPPGRSGLRLP